MDAMELARAIAMTIVTGLIASLAMRPPPPGSHREPRDPVTPGLTRGRVRL